MIFQLHIDFQYTSITINTQLQHNWLFSKYSEYLQKLLRWNYKFLYKSYKPLYYLKKHYKSKNIIKIKKLMKCEY